MTATVPVGVSVVLAGTGEIVRAIDADTLLQAAGIDDIREVDTAQLARFIADDVALLSSIATEARGLVSDELVRRLDMRGKWTLRDGGYEIKSSSPAAGTVAYNTVQLRAALVYLVDADVIDQLAASAAVETVWPMASVPYSLLADVLKAMNSALGCDEEQELYEAVESLLGAQPDPSHVQRPAGIQALLKVPGARATIEACRVEVPAPRRAAKVKSVAR